MSIRLPRYSGFPPEIFERGIVPRMSSTAVRLYLFLCRTSDRKSTLQFPATDKEIRLQTGASARALGEARTNLKMLGLIHCEKAPGGSYTYILCDVETGRPFPGDPKVKAQYIKREKNPQKTESVPPAPIAAIPDSRTDFAESDSALAEETDFAFGHNEKPIWSPIPATDFSPFPPSHPGK
jgi:hypothetical protein